MVFQTSDIKGSKYMQKRHINSIILHCSASPPSLDIGASTIRDWHLERGFNDIGYHYVIRLNGKIEQGRPISRIGAHASGFNKHSIGICYVGGVNDKNECEDTRTDSQKFAMFLLCSRLVEQYNIQNVVGHRDLPRVNKCCPSFDVVSWWGKCLEILDHF
jgi:N-acetylmuramoyl-L-alanine amidase